MKRKRKLMICLGVAVLAVIATAIAQIRLVRYLDDNYGETYEYYKIGEVVELGENKQSISDTETLNGYSIRVDDAQVLTYEEFLAWSGQTEESAKELLGNVVALPEKVCLVTTTVYNEDSDAQGISFQYLFCQGDTYDMSMDYELTVVANSFLLDVYQDQLVTYGYVGVIGIYLNPGENATIYLVYDFSKSYFNARHWEKLANDTLWIKLTYFPVRKVVEVPLR